MLDKIEQLEKMARLLEPTAIERAGIQKAAIDYSEAYLNNIEQLKAYQVTEDKGRQLLEHPIQEKGIPIEEIVTLIKDHVDYPGLNPASGGHIAYVPGGGIYPSAIGDYLADIANQYAGVFYASPGAVRMENMLLRWMCDLFGFPTEAGGNLTSGGSIANLIAIVAARDFKNLKSKDFSKIVIYSTEQVHHCTRKAVHISGLYEAVQRNVPMDEGFRMNPEALAACIEADKKQGLIPFMVMASAGTTDTGAIDPLNNIADVCQTHNLWFHVDGAYGGFFMLTEEIKDKLKGIERADSIVIDPHKGLFLPYGSGAVLVRNAKWLYDSMHMQASYMQDSFHDMEELSPSDLSPELTKPFRGLRLWLPLKLLGLAPFRACLSEKIWLCRYFYEAIQEIEGFEVGPYPELSVAMYRYVPKDGRDADQFNLDLTNRIKEDGRVFVSSTTINGKVYLRLAVLSFRTHKSTIDTLLEILKSFT